MEVFDRGTGMVFEEPSKRSGRTGSIPGHEEARRNIQIEELFLALPVWNTPRAPDDPKGQVWVLFPCILKIVIDSPFRYAGSKAQVRIKGRHECRAERRSAVGCELLVGSGPESVHHGTGGYLCIPGPCLGRWGMWDKNVEEIGVTEFGNRGERHCLGGCCCSRRHAGGGIRQNTPIQFPRLMRFNDVIVNLPNPLTFCKYCVCTRTTIISSTLNMPMRYRGDSPPLQPLYPDPIEPTDADDSIVLSDLVRTGEASRLRRRGAMRLDHNLLSAQRNEGGRVTPPTVVVARTPSWIEPPSDDDESTQAWEQGYDPSSPRPQGRSVVPGPEAYGYTLYCGGQETLSSFAQQVSAYVRSPLPSYPPTTSVSSLRRRDDPSRKTNGCGAVIHLRASRRDGSSVWVGKDEATSAVVPMDASYFERRTVVRMIRSACGCVREGVGCAIW